MADEEWNRWRDEQWERDEHDRYRIAALMRRERERRESDGGPGQVA